MFISKQIFAAFAGRYARELNDQPADVDDEDNEETVLPRQLFELVRTNVNLMNNITYQINTFCFFKYPLITISF